MRSDVSPIFFLPLMIILFSFPLQATDKNGYLARLFTEIDKKEKNESYQPDRQYQKLIDQSPAFNLLDKYPDLKIGKIRFVSKLPNELQDKNKEIKQGQRLITEEVIPERLANKTFTFKELIDQIDTSFFSKDSKLNDEDWVIIASAFRSLRAPDSAKNTNALGIFIAEYIILNLINNIEKKSDRTQKEEDFLATLYYILSEIYQNLAKYPDRYHLIQSRKDGRRGPIYFAFPKTYLPQTGYRDSQVFTKVTIVDYYMPYRNPYNYALLPGYNLSFDNLMGYRLDLLRGALIRRPNYYYAWLPLIEFLSMGFVSPYYQSRLSPTFWDTYFPGGIVDMNPIFLERLSNRWDTIATTSPALITGVDNSALVTENLRTLQTTEGRQVLAERAVTLQTQATQQEALTTEKAAAQQARTDERETTQQARRATQSEAIEQARTERGKPEVTEKTTVERGKLEATESTKAERARPEVTEKTTVERGKSEATERAKAERVKPEVTEKATVERGKSEATERARVERPEPQARPQAQRGPQPQEKPQVQPRQPQVSPQTQPRPQPQALPQAQPSPPQAPPQAQSKPQPQNQPKPNVSPEESPKDKKKD